MAPNFHCGACDIPGDSAASVGPRQASDPPALDTTKLETVFCGFGDEAGHSALDSITNSPSRTAEKVIWQDTVSVHWTRLGMSYLMSVVSAGGVGEVPGIATTRLCAIRFRPAALCG
jgi:hypothetical protein